VVTGAAEPALGPPRDGPKDCPRPGQARQLEPAPPGRDGGPDGALGRSSTLNARSWTPRWTSCVRRVSRPFPLRSSPGLADRAWGASGSPRGR